MKITSVLQEYQTRVAVPNNEQPEQIYSDMAFGSLHDAPTVFDALFPVGNPNRQRILNRFSCEQSGHPVGQGTPQAQTNYGQPCN